MTTGATYVRNIVSSALCITEVGHFRHEESADLGISDYIILNLNIIDCTYLRDPDAMHLFAISYLFNIWGKIILGADSWLFGETETYSLDEIEVYTSYKWLLT